jgi:cyclopropane-fatty-acyl-phospholipid synthase
MNVVSLCTNAVERLPLPDAVTGAGVSFLVGQRARQLRRQQSADAAFAAEMRAYPIAAFTDAANAQHYELPPDFFAAVLGPRRKYSCCLYDEGVTTLAQAEERALAATVAHADVHDGQRILELGCGWGSLSLWMAERFPNAAITAVSNSQAQRRTIEAIADRRRLRNLTVITRDMNDLVPEGQFDRVVSVEMFEHMSNWTALLEKVRGWLAPDGRLFVHVFTHRQAPYRFDHGDKADWIAQHFFTGGLMPSHGLMRCFPEVFAVEEEWRWSGAHYQRTAMDWLANFDAHREQVDVALVRTYGAQAGLWRRRWRLFFLATAGLFGHAGGSEWGVSHYRLRPA